MEGQLEFQIYPEYHKHKKVEQSVKDPGLFAFAQFLRAKANSLQWDVTLFPKIQIMRFNNSKLRAPRKYNMLWAEGPQRLESKGLG